MNVFHHQGKENPSLTWTIYLVETWVAAVTVNDPSEPIILDSFVDVVTSGKLKVMRNIDDEHKRTSHGTPEYTPW